MTNALRMALVLGTFLSSTMAQANEQLAQKYGCVACHQADKKVVGPAWKSIGEKYSDGSVSPEQLAKSIKAGGMGKWGPLPMPPQPAVSDADALALANWILKSK